MVSRISSINSRDDRDGGERNFVLCVCGGRGWIMDNYAFCLMKESDMVKQMLEVQLSIHFC